MKQALLSILLSAAIFLAASSSVQAQRQPTPMTASAAALLVATTSADSTNSATLSGELATPAATIQQKVQEKASQDITEVTGTSKDKLVEWLDQNSNPTLTIMNPLQYLIHRAVNNGLPANIVVLILLFPVITSFIAFSRHVIGLKGFGVYIPAVLSVAFVSTGIVNGIVLFLIILGAAMFTRKVVRRLRMQALPRTAMLLWGVSIIVLLVLVALAFMPANALLTVNIFPLLIIMLLTENFMESQLISSQSEATQLTIETLVTAIICSVIIGNPIVQQQVILYPELTLISVAAINLIVSRYSGLRLLEWIRFRSIIE